MTKIYTYISKQFLKPLVFISFAFGFVVMISEFFREMSMYMELKTPFFTIVEYLLLNLPWWMIDVFAVSVLLALLFSLGELAKRNEITALKASGVNLWRIICLFMFLGFCIGIFDFSMREFVIPKTVIQAEYVKKVKIRKKTFGEVENEHKNIIVTLPNNSRMSIGYLNIKENYMKDIIIDKYNDKYYLTENLVVGEGVYTNGGWLLRHGVIRTFDDKNNWNEQYFESKVFGFTVKPQDLIVKDTRYEQMNLKDFKEYIRKKQMLGQNTLKEQIKYHSRFANVFAHIIVMMIGIPFALGLGNKFGKIISFTFALIFSFIYWCVQAVCMSLGENQVVSVWLAAWLPNILFGVVGIYLMSKIKK